MFPSFFRIRSGEGRRVWLMMLYAAAYSGGVVTVGYRGVGSALFLSRLPASATPYLFILPAIAITITLLLYNRAAARWKATPLVLGSTIFLLVLTLLFRGLLETQWSSSFELLASIYLFTEAAMSLIGIQLWVIAGRIFNAREARRLFPLIVGGGTLASICAGFLLGPLAALFGVDNLLFVLAFALFICLISARALAGMEKAMDREGQATSAAAAARRIERAEDRQSTTFWRTIRAIRKSPLLLAVAVLTVLLSLLINIGAYQFFRALQDNFSGRGEAMVAFLGGFEVWIGCAALLVQFLVAPVVIRRFGAFAGLLFFPGAIALAAGASLISGGTLLSMAFIRSADPVFRSTINDTALNLLYLPVPAGLRQHARELFGGLYAATFGLLGLLFLLAQTALGWPYLYWSVPALVLSLVWLGSLRWARREYMRALTDNLRSLRFDLRGSHLAITDPSAVQVLVAALQDADELRVVHALEIISGAPEVNWDPYVAPLLSHVSADVRVQALRHLGRPGNRAYIGAVAASLTTPEDHVCEATIEAYCGILGAGALQRVEPFLSDARPRVRSAALYGFLRYGGEREEARAVACLKDMLTSEHPAIRREGARALGTQKLPGSYAMLLPLFDDPEPEVRVSALRAAGALRVPELASHVASKLNDRAARSAASEALVDYGPTSLPLLAELLASEEESRSVREQVPSIIARIITPGAPEILIAHISEGDDRVRWAVCRALAKLKQEVVISSLPMDKLRSAVLNEIRNCYRLYLQREATNSAGERSLLDEALMLRYQRSLGAVLDLLELQYGSSQIRAIREAIYSEDSKRRPQAIELLDNLSLGPPRDLLVALLEAPVSEVTRIAGKRFSIGLNAKQNQPRSAVLMELVGSSDSWIRACAIWQIAQERDRGAAVTVTAALDAEDNLVRETAQAASRHLLDSEQTPAMAASRGSGERPQGSIASYDGVREKGRFTTLSTIERVLALKQIPLFASIASEELAAIAELAEEVRFEAGETIIRQGEVADCLYVVVDGETAIHVDGVGQVAMRSAPTVLGEMALVLRQPRSATCVGITGTITLRIDQEPFEELLSQRPQIALGVIKVLGERLHEGQRGVNPHE